jgi:hypothetical protein
MTKQLETQFQHLEAEFKNVFPKGFFEMYTVSTGRLYIKLGLIDDINVVANHIRENDPMYHVFWVDQQNDQLLTEELTGGLSCDPLSNYYAMSITKTKFRKASGDFNKVNKHLVKWFNTLKSIVVANKDTIYGRHNFESYITQ